MDSIWQIVATYVKAFSYLWRFPVGFNTSVRRVILPLNNYQYTSWKILASILPIYVFISLASGSIKQNMLIPLLSSKSWSAAYARLLHRQWISAIWGNLVNSKMINELTTILTSWCSVSGIIYIKINKIYSSLLEI